MLSIPQQRLYERFRLVWRMICQTYNHNPNPFEHGASKDTLVDAIYDTARTINQNLWRNFNPGARPALWVRGITAPELRTALEFAESEGWMIVKVDQWGRKCYFLRNPSTKRKRARQCTPKSTLSCPTSKRGAMPPTPSNPIPTF